MNQAKTHRIAVLVLALAAMIAALAAAPAAAKKVPRSFYGVVPQTQLGEADYPKMAEGRVGTLRTAFVWAIIDPSASPADYDWSAYDTLVANAAAAGVQVLPDVTSTPTWVSDLDGCKGSCYTNPPRSQVARLAFRSFLQAAVERYGPNGTLWAEHPELKPKPITDWQIWNEQNSPQYFTPRPDPAVYAKLVTDADNAITSVDPTAKIILGGMFATPGGKLDPDTNSWTYLRALYRQGNVADHFDGVAIHPYAQGMRKVKLQVELLRKEMKRANDAATGLWVTEIGWASRGPSDSPQVAGVQGQAQKLKKSFRFFTNNRRRLHVRNIDWFSWRDTHKDFKVCYWCPKTGLFTRDGFQAKPVWQAFKEFTRPR
jgi:hypothetical protein